MTSESIRILLADDHEVVRAGLRRLLESEPGFEIVAEAGSGEDAYRKLGALRIDVAVIDLSMPGMGGLEAIRRIRARRSEVKILVFSIHESACFAQRALSAGAEGYLTKSSPAAAMIEAVRAVAEGRHWLAREVAQNLALQSLGQQGSPMSELTAREFEVLRLFALGRQPDEIAVALHLSAKTVANHLSLIKQKLGARSAAELMRRALDWGLVSE